MVLGGSAWIDIIKAFADENNIHLVAVGNDSHSPLASVGEYHNVDSTDHENKTGLFVRGYIRLLGLWREY